MILTRTFTRVAKNFLAQPESSAGAEWKRAKGVSIAIASWAKIKKERRQYARVAPAESKNENRLVSIFGAQGAAARHDSSPALQPGRRSYSPLSLSLWRVAGGAPWNLRRPERAVSHLCPTSHRILSSSVLEKKPRSTILPRMQSTSAILVSLSA